jgi:hypothetical protein
MLLLKLERVDGEYVLKIPKEQVLRHDLREGQLLAVAVEPVSDFETMAVDENEPVTESWKLNETRSKYAASPNGGSA